MLLVATAGPRSSVIAMHSPVNLRVELRDTLKLAGPIVLNQVGHMSMGLVDTLVAGRISTTALGGLGLGANFFWTFTNVCMGLLLALDTYFSQSVGARDHSRLARYFGQSLWSSLLVTVLAGVGVLAGTVIYLHFASPGPIPDAFRQYLEGIVWCLPSLFLFFVLQRYWQARHRVLGFTIIIVAANVLNLAACFALGLGHWGFPRLEVRGLALATVISRYFMLLLALAYTWYLLRPRSLRLPRIDWRAQKKFVRLGAPAAGHTALEIGAFTIVTFVAGALGAVPLAAHNVALMLAAFTFMFSLGFSSAAAVRVGFYIGAGEPRKAVVAGWLCLGLAVVTMSVFGVGYLVLPRTLLGWFSHDPAVIGLGVKILMFVALFQIADGAQVCVTGALRGLGNTRTAMIANLIGHYPVGLTLGVVLCFGFDFGVLGLWTGLAVGLFCVSAILLRAWTVAARQFAPPPAVR